MHAHSVDFIKNALFNSSGGICWPSIDSRDSNRFISRRLSMVCSSSDSSYDWTDLSLATLSYQLRFLLWICWSDKYYLIMCIEHYSRSRPQIYNVIAIATCQARFCMIMLYLARGFIFSSESDIVGPGNTHQLELSRAQNPRRAAWH